MNQIIPIETLVSSALFHIAPYTVLWSVLYLIILILVLTFNTLPRSFTKVIVNGRVVLHFPLHTFVLPDPPVSKACLKSVFLLKGPVLPKDFF